MNTVSPRRLSDIRNDFERGVFMALYTSPRQRRYRGIAHLLLVIKHGLRGILFSWPLYLLPLAGAILRRGIREDYARLVDGYILKPGYAARILFPGTLPS
jgi:hypothetical protein